MASNGEGDGLLRRSAKNPRLELIRVCPLYTIKCRGLIVHGISPYQILDSHFVEFGPNGPVNISGSDYKLDFLVQYKTRIY